MTVRASGIDTTSPAKKHISQPFQKKGKKKILTVEFSIYMENIYIYIRKKESHNVNHFSFLV